MDALRSSSRIVRWSTRRKLFAGRSGWTSGLLFVNGENRAAYRKTLCWRSAVAGTWNELRVNGAKGIAAHRLATPRRLELEQIWRIRRDSSIRGVSVSSGRLHALGLQPGVALPQGRIVRNGAMEPGRS